MHPPGELLASGRDADIFEYGPGLVLRRTRDGRSLALEARTMEYLATQGYPVPVVHELSDDSTEMVMDRVDGPSLLGALSRRPWQITSLASVLADLHHRLHEVQPAPFLPAAPVGTGDRIVHLDLHPLNVILGPNGPVVIDWTGASIGDPNADVAVAWTLMAAGAIPAGRAMRTVLGWGRAMLVRSFVSHFDRAVVAGELREVVTWKVNDPHMAESEVKSMWDLVEREESRSSRDQVR